MLKIETRKTTKHPHKCDWCKEEINGGHVAALRIGESARFHHDCWTKKLAEIYSKKEA